MKNFILRIRWALFGVLFFTGSLSANVDSRLSFSHYSVENGLSQVSISSICQDSDGNMWFGTHDGLNRFDGSKFSVFRHNPEDSTSLASNFIFNVIATSGRYIVVLADGGISVYDISKGSFIDVHWLRGFPMRCMTNIDDSAFLGASENEVFLINLERGTMDRRIKTREDSIIRAMTLVGVTCYLLMSDCNILAYDLSSGRMLFDSDILRDRNVFTMCADNNGSLWLGSDGNGLFCFDPSTGEIVHYDKNSGLSSNFVRSVETDKDGNIWIGTATNLCVMDGHSGRFSTYVHDPNIPESLSDYSIRKVFMDSMGGVWIGTYYGGLNYYHPQRNLFHTIPIPYGSDKIIRSIGMDGDGKIWIGTSRSDLFIYDPKSNMSTQMNLMGRRASVSERNTINASVYDASTGKMLLGSSVEGLCIKDTRGGALKRVLGSDCYYIRRGSEGNYLVGTLLGLYRYNVHSSEVEQMFKGDVNNERVFTAYRDSVGKYWVGLDTRMLVFSSNRDVKPRSLNIRQPQDVHENDNIWIASINGLYYVSKPDFNLKRYGTEDGLPSNVIRGIEEDSFGRLWLSTENGLCCFDARSGKVLRTYNVTDGLQGNKFNPFAHAKAPDGTLYFGGTNGVTYFKPGEQLFNSISVEPVISEIRINGEEEKPGAGNHILDNVPSHTSSITLKPSQSHLELKLSMPNFVSAGYDLIQYRLVGVDPRWRTVVNGGNVVYNNLSKGKYTFEYSALGGGLENHPKLFTIIMKPKWSQTALFSISVAVLLGLVLTSLMMFLIRRVEKINRQKLDSFKARTMEEMAWMRVGAMLQDSQTFVKKADQDFVLSALAVVDANISNDSYSVETMASDLNMSRSNLHLKLKRITGLSALDFIRRVKFDKACSLLRENKSSITEIAYQCGFSSSGYFSTCFKAETGLTPREWQKRYIQQF